MQALTIDEAAELLRKTARWLKAWLTENPVDDAGVPFYVPAGRTKIFEASDVARIRAHIENAPTKRKKENVVYLVAVRGFIKIGYTNDWPRRFAEMQVSNPELMQILLIIGRPSIYEKTLHQKFAEHRALGEWFNDHPDIRAYIDEHKHECWARSRRFL